MRKRIPKLPEAKGPYQGCIEGHPTQLNILGLEESTFAGVGIESQQNVITYHIAKARRKILYCSDLEIGDTSSWFRVYPSDLEIGDTSSWFRVYPSDLEIGDTSSWFRVYPSDLEIGDTSSWFRVYPSDLEIGDTSSWFRVYPSDLEIGDTSSWFRVYPSDLEIGDTYWRSGVLVYLKLSDHYSTTLFKIRTQDNHLLFYTIINSYCYCIRRNISQIFSVKY